MPEEQKPMISYQNRSRITAASIGGAITICAVWVLDLTTGVKPPAEVVVGMTTIVTAVTQVVIRKMGGELG